MNPLLSAALVAYVVVAVVVLSATQTYVRLKGGPHRPWRTVPLALLWPVGLLVAMGESIGEGFAKGRGERL